MFIWDFVAAKVLGQIVDWFYSQIVGFLGNFFSEMGNMGAELFTMDWVQSIVLFFSYLAWALYGTGLVVACFETGVEYSSGRGNIRETALNAIKGFMAVSLFTVVPVRLYELCVSLQGTFTAALTGYGTSIGDVAGEVMQEFNAVESISDLTAGPLLGFGSITSGIMILFCIILMAYAIIKVFFANLKRGGILLIQIAVGSLYMFSVPRGYTDGFIQWCKQIIGLCRRYNISDETGNVYVVTTHQFRHNGITDRLAAGFTAAQIAEMTGHHGDAMIFNAYAHLNLMPETIREKQNYVLAERQESDKRYVLFGGRILNMDEQVEQRLMKNLRAHRVRGGICSDITTCKSDMWNCLECKAFVADTEQTEYYREQISLWREKQVRFSAFPIICENAKRNAGLFESILKSIETDVQRNEANNT